MTSSRRELGGTSAPSEGFFLERLLLKSDAMLDWFNLGTTKTFMEYLYDLLRVNQEVLQDSEEINKMLRAQGAIGVLKLALGAKHEILEYKEGLRTGKMKPLTQERR